ncbi:hypothetical protein Tco_1415417 [Tanacetum coccineum]
MNDNVSFKNVSFESFSMIVSVIHEVIPQISFRCYISKMGVLQSGIRAHGYREQGIKSTPEYIYPIIILSDSDVEDTFSSTHSPDYIPALSDYSLASPGNTSPNFSDDLTKDLLSSLSISLFHDDPYMKIIQAYDTIPPLQVIITLPAVLPPSLVLSLSPMFDSRDSFPSEKISPPKDTETPISPSSLVESSSPIRSTTPPPDYLFNESIFAKLDNLLVCV